MSKPESAASCFTVLRKMSVHEKILVIKEGIPKEWLVEVQERLGFRLKEILKLVRLSPSSWYRYKERLPMAVGDRVVLLYELVDQGEKAFNGNLNSFIEWFRTPNLLLADLSPMEMWSLPLGNIEVSELISRIRTADFIV